MVLNTPLLYTDVQQNICPEKCPNNSSTVYELVSLLMIKLQAGYFLYFFGAVIPLKLREKRPNTQFFLAFIFRYRTEFVHFNAV